MPAARSPQVLRLTPHFYWPQLAASSWPVKFDAIGGMQSQIYRLTRALDEAGLEQTVLTLRIPGAPTSWRMSGRTEVRGVRIPVLPLRSRIRGMVDLNFSWALGVLSYLLRCRRRPDLLHVHCSGVAIPPLLGWLLSRVLRVPLVLTIHCSIIVTYHPMNALDRMLQPLARRIERMALGHAAHNPSLCRRHEEGRLHCAAGRDRRRRIRLPCDTGCGLCRSAALGSRDRLGRRRLRRPHRKREGLADHSRYCGTTA